MPTFTLAEIAFAAAMAALTTASSVFALVTDPPFGAVLAVLALALDAVVADMALGAPLHRSAHDRLRRWRRDRRRGPRRKR